MTTELGMPSRGDRRIWPDQLLDVNGLQAEGWEARPIRQFVVKVNSRCNLACDYCYVYTMADQSWRSQPVRMNAAVVEAAGSRIAEHAQRHQLSSVQIVLHGGEPLLAGPGGIREIVSAIKRAVGAATTVQVGVQTNGVLLDTEFLTVLASLDVRVAVSLDGGREANDTHRRYANGKGSYEHVARGLRLLGRHFPELYSGLLCTVDIVNDPVETYEALLDFEPPSVDFLLPHANWATPPNTPEGLTGSTAYGAWLCAVFDRWYTAGGRETHVRYLEEIVALIFGGASRSELIGLAPVSVIVVETDGTLQQVDTLKSAQEGAPATGMNVFRHSMDDVLRHPSVVARQLGISGLSETCQSCRLGTICGGGYYPHRYHPDNGFLNPSVYCADLAHLIMHVRKRVLGELESSAGRK